MKPFALLFSSKETMWFFIKVNFPAFPVCDFSQTRNHNTHITEEKKSLVGREKTEEIDMP